MANSKIKVRTDRAVSQFGGVPALANHLGVTREAVYQWGEYVPEVRAYQLRDEFPELVEGAGGGLRQRKSA